MKFATKVVSIDTGSYGGLNPANVPIFQTATFRQESATEFGQYDYSRSGNPTRDAVEKQIAKLEGGRHGFGFSSGLAAITAVTRLLRPGEEILACDDLYGGTYRLFSRILEKRGIVVRYGDFTDFATVKSSVTDKTKLVFLETPTNPLLQIIDIAAVSQIAHRSGALVCVDNTTMSPYLQRPLEHGADIVVHSATKFLCGHSDVMAGAAVVADDELAEEIYFIQNGEGACLSPFDSFLLLRGMKTLSLRLDRQQENARKIADFLQSHDTVERVYFPGLVEVEQLRVHQKQASGYGAVISFRTGDLEVSRKIVEATKIFTIAVSFGGLNSTISLPCCMSHASIPVGVRAQRNVPSDLVRLSVGVEDPTDLIEDLEQAFDKAQEVARGQQYSITA